VGFSATILVADDESRMRQLVRVYLEKDGFQVIEAADGEEVMARLEENDPDLVVLDLMMPKVDGWETCRRIRAKSDIPVIILTARGEELDRLLGFELGADDYVVKPFSPRELVARVKALLRRVQPEKKDGGRVLRFPGLVIDEGARTVTVNGHEVGLTPKEYDLLHFLARHPGQVFSREQILEKVWGYDFYGDARTVDTHIKNIRDKLGGKGDKNSGAGRITTVWGVGYKFEPQ